ncbi:MAG: type 1 pili tip component [Woeseiaceae bacterium]
MSFKHLIDKWQTTPAITKSDAQYQFRLDTNDAARVEALASLFPGLDAESIIADLLHEALDSLEAAIPYEAGDKIIQKDEFDDPVYEDVGLMPAYVALLRAQSKT